MRRILPTRAGLTLCGILGLVAPRGGDAQAVSRPSVVLARGLGRSDAGAGTLGSWDASWDSSSGASWDWERGRTAPFVEDAGRRSAAVVAASAVVPGSGQLWLGKRRGWAFLAIEALGWVAYADRKGAGNTLRTEYRDFAWATARRQPGERVDGDFAYYEVLSHWTRSGAFDLDAAAVGVQPESDPSTYNGSIWARAASLFGAEDGTAGDPGYTRALEYYGDHAYGSPFLWDWTGTGSARSEYADLIRRSDSGFRQATNVLGAIIANHVVSAVDAFLGARATAAGLQSGVVPERGLTGARWHVGIRWGQPTPRSAGRLP